MKSLEEFDKENEAKRARLLKDHAVAHALPTTGVVVAWTGEGGWESDGNTRKPDVEKSVGISPWIIHSPFRGAEHVAYKAPDGSKFDGGGEHVSSPHRKEFVRKYFAALLDTYAPCMLDMLAVKDPKRYASHVPSSFDYKAHRDYTNANEIARGLYEITVSTGKGYSSASLAFYVNVDGVGPVKISFTLDRDFPVWKLLPRAHYRGSYDNAEPDSWTFPPLSQTGAVNMWKRSNCDRNQYGQPSGWTLEHLFATRADMERALAAP